ncbi:hypothetical protein MOC71_05685 [Bacillus vallismortis]|uniref:Uncharacterized protein n=1 Tax=Bacillus vallismortis TaxID=72361 RepID=A0AAP3CH97_BACVA|nr:hypothetical protein [Bacillus vallismortis]MCY8316246.1 hypothetical protein [Bacillus vallismortis]MEC1651003.1 hypothetical protein [Bacillus vallismortis]
MIIWINGAFGFGITQTAFELHRRLKPSYMYNPEKKGSMIPPEIAEEDFQSYSLWRAFNYSLLASLPIHTAGSPIFAEHLQTDNMSIQDAAETIAARASLTLAPDTRGNLRRFTDRLIVKLNHIRIK